MDLNILQIVIVREANLIKKLSLKKVISKNKKKKEGEILYIY